MLVSKPEITVDGPVIVDKPFWILCHSENGSMPIIYSLKRNNFILNWTKVSHFQEEARFFALISTPSDISSYFCEAENNGQVSIKMSERLHVTVIGEFIVKICLALICFHFPNLTENFQKSFLPNN